MPRHQHIDVAGIRAVKHGAPWGPGDIYYELMEMGWAAFVGVVSVVFVAVNLAFGAVYALLPGAIAHLPPGSLASGFFFSVETMTTVGYGVVYPLTVVGHVVVTVEILTGMFLIAMLYGLIFQRFARPREGMMFSDALVVTEVDGRRLVMLRLAGTRARPLADVAVQFGLLETVRVPSGREYKRNANLPLINDRNSLMILAWTVVHVVDDASPLASVLDGDIPLRLTVTVRALDTLVSSAVFASKVYGRDDLRHGHEFVDVIDYHDDGSVHLDLTRLHATRPAAAAAAADDGPGGAAHAATTTGATAEAAGDATD